MPTSEDLNTPFLVQGAGLVNAFLLYQTRGATEPLFVKPDAASLSKSDIVVPVCVQLEPTVSVVQEVCHRFNRLLARVELCI